MKLLNQLAQPANFVFAEEQRFNYMIAATRSIMFFFNNSP